MSTPRPRRFATLSIFMIDEFAFLDEEGKLLPDTVEPQIGGGGTYAVIGARIWLPANDVGMIVHKGDDFPKEMLCKLLSYGSDAWVFRDRVNEGTSRGRVTYCGDDVKFEYITPLARVTPRDLDGTPLQQCSVLHFMSLPSRAASALEQIRQVKDWNPVTIYEPVPVRVKNRSPFLSSFPFKYSCVPEELPNISSLLSDISIFSPNAEEALSLLSHPLPPTKAAIESVAQTLFSLSPSGPETVVIRAGRLGAYVLPRDRTKKSGWVDAYWTEANAGGKVVNTVGAGNAFLGGLGASLTLTGGDAYEATFYASVSASYTIEQPGLPSLTRTKDEERWNGDSPHDRLEELRERHRHPGSR